MIERVFFSLLLILTVQPLLGAEPMPAREQWGVQTIVMVGIAIVFFYFILWRPEQKRRQVLEAERARMKKGDKVVAMGIVGTVDQVKESTVILTMCDGGKIEVLSGAVTEVNETPTKSSRVSNTVAEVPETPTESSPE